MTRSLKFLALAALLSITGPALAQNTIPYESGTGGIGTGVIPRAGTDSGSTIGELVGSACTDNGTIWSCAESVDAQGNAFVTEIANAGTTGTTLHSLAKLTGAPSTAVITATTDITGIVGIVTGGAGTSGNAQIAVEGQALCNFDATSVVAGDYVQNSTVTAGDCADAGSTLPTSGGRILGRALASGAGSTTYNVSLFGPGINAASGSAGSQTIGGSGQSQAEALTKTYPPFSSVTSGSGTSLVAALAPKSMTFSKLYAQVSGAPGVGQSDIFTLMVNSTATAVTCTISGSATTCNDTTDTAAITAGENYYIQLVTGATAVSTGGEQWGFSAQ